jgi:peptidyl-tRNA hydrolase, PTH1 family
MYLIVGLGNPGKNYENTRHNIGFLLLDRFARSLDVSFKKNDKIKSDLALGSYNEQKLLLMKPTTFMNNSGIAVRKALDFYKISLSDVLVVVDDADINLLEFRLKKGGGTAGHNGLKSIEEHVGSLDFARLRVGIGRDENKELADYVLETFSKEEQEPLIKILDQGVNIIKSWLDVGLEKTMTFTNVRIKELKNE